MLRLFRPHGPPPLIRLTPWRRVRKMWRRLTRIFDARSSLFHLRRTRRRIEADPVRPRRVRNKKTLKILRILLFQSQTRIRGRKKSRPRVGRARSPKYKPRHLQQSRGRRLLMRNGQSRARFLRSHLRSGHAFTGPVTPCMRG